LVIAGVVGLSAGSAQNARTAFDRLFERYASGDYDALPQAIRLARDYGTIRGDFEAARKVWLKDWKRVYAVFQLELAAIAFRNLWPNRMELLSGGSAYVQARPHLIGEKPEDDAFEGLWQKAALGILLGTLDSPAFDRYLDSIATRVGATPSTNAAAPRIVDPRLAFMKATATEQLLLPVPRVSSQIRVNGGVTQSVTVGSSALDAAQALREFDAAAFFDGNAAESAVRRANVLLYMHRPDEALQSLDRLPADQPAGMVRFWRDLLRGRAYEASERFADAIKAFTDARGQYPNAQSPIVALSLMNFRLGNAREARQWSATLYGLPRDAEDPWWIYCFGDARFFGPWLAELRRMAR
jgi:tetratricopeptide (TPR) repeat protein